MYSACMGSSLNVKTSSALLVYPLFDRSNPDGGQTVQISFNLVELFFVKATLPHDGQQLFDPVVIAAAVVGHQQANPNLLRFGKGQGGFL